MRTGAGSFSIAINVIITVFFHYQRVLTVLVVARPAADDLVAHALIHVDRDAVRDAHIQAHDWHTGLLFAFSQQGGTDPPPPVFGQHPDRGNQGQLLRTAHISGDKTHHFAVHNGL